MNMQVLNSFNMLTAVAEKPIWFKLGLNHCRAELIVGYITKQTRWRHQLISVLLARVRGIHRWIPRKKASDAELWWFPWIMLNKRVCKQT